MKITCYGPRGSLPAPSREGFSTIKYGGNTSCYYVEAGPFRVILDNGSGVANLGDDLIKRLLVPQVQVTGKMGMHFINLFSHYHHDHIQGLPFCGLYFIGGNTLHIHGHTPRAHEANGNPRTAVERILSEQQADPHFPVAFECLPATKVYSDHSRQFSEVFWYVCDLMNGSYIRRDTAPPWGGPNEVLPENLLKITTIPLNHPDGCLGYRIEYMGKVVVYCTDNEPLRHTNAQINKHGKGADWMLLDGQYPEALLSTSTQAFGHGTPNACVEQATACDAKRLVIHHHDPKHDDTTVGAMEVSAQEYATRSGYGGVVEFAREGMVWEI